jgi:ferrous iron transport protein A
MASPVRLSELPVGAEATVTAIDVSDAGSIRLREMGLLVGARLTFVRSAPMGDPMEIKVRGYRLTLRRTEAALVTVQPTTP